MDKLVNLFLDGDIPKENYLLKKNELLKQKVSLTQKLSSAPTREKELGRTLAGMDFGYEKSHAFVRLR